MLASSRTQSTDAVAEFTCTVEVPPLGNASPVTNVARIASSLGSIDITASPRKASRALAAISAPSLAISSSAALEVSQARTRCPAFKRLRVIALPMRPTPMKPTSMLPSIAFLSCSM